MPRDLSRTVYFVLLLLVLWLHSALAVSVQSSRLPHPFQFTENKGQWDSAVLYKCEVRRDGFTWFLERDGVTLVTSIVDSSRGGSPRPPVDPFSSRGGPPCSPTAFNSVIARTPQSGGRGNPLLTFFDPSSLVGAVREPPVSVNDARFDPNGRIHHSRLKSHALKFRFVDSRRGESHTPLSDQDAFTCLCEERSEGSSAEGGKPQRSDEAIYSLNESKTQEEITFGEPFGVASSFHFGSASHVPSFIPRKYKIRIQDTRLGRMPYAPTEKYSTQEEVGINSDLPFAQAKRIDAQGELSWHNNYFLGNDSSKWAPDCRNFTRVVYREVWAGIDVEFYESKGHLEFDFVAHPGADPKQIQMVCEGLEAPIAGGGRTLLSVDSDISVTKGSRTGVSDSLLSNELSLMTSLGELRMKIPGAYQTTSNGARGNDVAAQFRLETRNVFAIDLPIGYDASQTLRIDPLVYSTYLGGSGTDEGMVICKTTTGNIVVAGDTQSSDFPVTSGAFDTTLSATDVFVSSINSLDNQLLFSTYLGGNSDDFAVGICADPTGGTIVCGSTGGAGFPVSATAFDRTQPIHDNKCYIMRLNASGSRIIYSFLLGSNNALQEAQSVISDANGGAYVTGYTEGLNFPCTSDAYSTLPFYSTNVFLTHLNSTGSNLIYSSYFGGNSQTIAYKIDFDDSGRVAIAGMTASTNLPTTSNCYSSQLRGGGNCFLTVFSTDCRSLAYSTYIGGNCTDRIYGLSNDGLGGWFISGITCSSDFRVSPHGYDTTYHGGELGDAFVGHMTYTSTESSFLSTYIGGSMTDYSTSAQFNRLNHCVYSAGVTVSTEFPVTINSFDSLYNGGGTDGFIMKFNSTLDTLMYSTFIGGNNYDNCEGSVLVGSDTLAIVGRTNSTNFPVTGSAIDSTNQGGWDAFIVKFITLPESTDANEVKLTILPQSASIKAFPNPFNATTTLSYTLPISSHVELCLYDLTGREVSTLVQREQRPGTYRVLLDGSRLASGTYFVRLQAGTFSKTQKIVLLK